MLSDEQVRQDTLAVLRNQIRIERAVFDGMLARLGERVAKVDPITCPDCDGSGSVPQHSSSTYLVRCETCKGKGRK